MIRYGVKKSKRFSVETWKGFEELLNDKTGQVIYRIYHKVNYTRPEDALEAVKMYGEVSHQSGMVA